MCTTPTGPRRPLSTPVAIGSLIALVAVLVYYPVLDNFFYPIDDPLMIWSIGVGAKPTVHFRPLFSTWNSILLAVFGLQPFGWYLAGLIVHVINACLVAFLALRVSGRRVLAAVAGVTFAAFYSPNEAVMWIAANCTLLALLFVLLAASCWQLFLDAPAERRPRRWLAYGGALLFLAVATGFKEDCVLAGPLFLGLDLCRNGWRGLVRPRSLLAYLPLVAVGLTYLYLALHPSLWQDRVGVGGYRFEVGLVPELFQNLAWLFWPRLIVSEGWTAASVGAGLGLAGLLTAAGLRPGRRSPLLLLGLALGLLAMLPALPGPFAIAGSRYAYAPSIGAALVVAGVFGSLWERSDRAWWRGGLGLALATWIAIHGLSIRSVEQWRFDRACARLEHMVESSRAVVELPDASLISPPLFNPADYGLALVVWCGLPRHELAMEWSLYGEGFFERLSPGQDLDPASQRTHAFQNSGEVFRLRVVSDAPLEQWAERVQEYEERYGDRRLAVIHLRRSLGRLPPR